MADENESTSSVSSNKPDADNKAAGDVVDDETYKQMLEILKDLTDHTHTFYDDYGSACQCNCNCNCTCCTRKRIAAFNSNIKLKTLLIAGKSDRVKTKTISSQAKKKFLEGSTTRRKPYTQASGNGEQPSRLMI